MNSLTTLHFLFRLQPNECWFASVESFVRCNVCLKRVYAPKPSRRVLNGSAGSSRCVRRSGDVYCSAGWSSGVHRENIVRPTIMTVYSLVHSSVDSCIIVHLSSAFCTGMWEHERGNDDWAQLLLSPLTTQALKSLEVLQPDGCPHGIFKEPLKVIRWQNKRISLLEKEISRMAGIMKDANLQNVSLNSEKAIQYKGRVFIDESKRNRKPKCALSDTRKKKNSVACKSGHRVKGVKKRRQKCDTGYRTEVGKIYISDLFVSRQCWIIIYTSAVSNPAVSKPVLLHRWRWFHSVCRIGEGWL